jgi:hypothetical protein
MSNPFSTRYVRPGALSYLFPDGVTCETLLDRLQQNQGRGQITGGHGTGKSTLVQALLSALTKASRPYHLVELHDRQSWLPRDAWPGIRPNGILAIDGYEQLNRWNRFWVRFACRCFGSGLLVTAHTNVGFPEIWHTRATTELAKQIVHRLDPSKHVFDELPQLLARHQGNLREVLFELYDRHEESHRIAAAC